MGEAKAVVTARIYCLRHSKAARGPGARCIFQFSPESIVHTYVGAAGGCRAAQVGYPMRQLEGRRCKRSRTPDALYRWNHHHRGRYIHRAGASLRRHATVRTAMAAQSALSRPASYMDWDTVRRERRGGPYPTYRAGPAMLISLGTGVARCRVQAREEERRRGASSSGTASYLTVARCSARAAR